MNKLGFFDHHQRFINRGEWLSVEESKLPRFGEIWQTRHNDLHFVKIVCVAYSDDDEQIVVYNRCDEKGIFISLRTGSGENEKITKQPFCIHSLNFLMRYEKSYPEID